MARTLNKYQEEAVAHKDGPCLVTSCPGSGKTLTLVERVISLIKSGVSQKNILCLTFTNKAANEMKARICQRLGVAKPEFFIGTFHSLCSRLLRKFGSEKGFGENFNILDEKEQIDMVLQVSRNLGQDIEYGDARHIANTLNFYRDQMELFSWVEYTLKKDPFIDIAKGYIERCKNCNLFDFSGLIYDAIQIIEEDESIKRKVQNAFKYIMVDETQDTNKAQFYLVNLLGGKWKNIMLIGDVDQSVYGWRGARYQNIQEFINNYVDCRVISLSKNYRSTPQIVKLASKLIKNNSSHIDINFETDNPDGEPVKCYSFKDQIAEATWVGKAIWRFVNEGGWDPKDIVVLYRVNKMSEPIEQALVKNGVPYEVIGAWNFYDRREVRDCLSMIKLLANKKDGIAFHRVCNLIKGIGNITIGKIEKISEEKNISIPDACNEMAHTSKSITISEGCEKLYNIYNDNWDLKNPSLCLQKLIDKFHYKKYISDEFSDTCQEREDNINQLIDAAGEFIGEDNGVSKYLQQISLVTNNDKSNDDNKVSLMSFHAAKGLEFPVVFMVGVEKDILPHKKAVADDPYGGMEEERRLCYVGMTRAKKVLFMSWCKSRRRLGKFGNMILDKCKPSLFLCETDLVSEEE